MRFDFFLSKEKRPEGLLSVLKGLGPTWLSTPSRRLIQTICLILFLILFFYFCWPYRYDYSRENTGQIPEVWLFLILDPLVSISTALAARALVWSLAGVLRLNGRKVEATCVECGRCLYICPFDAIGSDFTTRSIDCANCHSCGGACPKQSIKFVSRWNKVNFKSPVSQPIVAPSASRRRFLFGTIAVIGSGTAAGTALLRERSSYAELYPIRPPGSLPEDRFRSQCVRCGECVKVCPGNVLQPAGFELGIDGIWTPKVTADWSGCVPFCNNCGQVCPTGAIRDLPLDEKRAARIGLAVVNKNTCLPHAQRENCGLCVSECAAAGYNAIEFIRITGLTDEQGMPIENSGYLAPVVLEDKCVGCGLCQARCQAINVRDKKLLGESAVRYWPTRAKKTVSSPASIKR